MRRGCFGLSKNIQIKIGNVSRTFSGVSKFAVTDLDTTQKTYFVDEDEAGQFANLIEKTVTQNGTYYAQYDGVDGYSAVIVSGTTDEETIYGALNVQKF